MSILAKSFDPTTTKVPREVFLEGHLYEVLRNADSIVRITGNQQLLAFGLPLESWGPRFYKTVRMAAAIHDVGKANSQFQNLLLRSPNSRDVDFPPIRHEWLSVWFAMQPAVKAWLMPAIDQDEYLWQCMIAAVAGHHPRAKRAAPGAELLNSEPVGLMTEHPDFIKCLTSIAEWLGIGGPLPKVEQVLYHGTLDKSGKAAFIEMVGEVGDFKFEPRSQRPLWQRFCAATKACLIAADVAGSALWEQVEREEGREAWLTESLGRNPTSADYAAVVSERLAGAVPREFQQQVAASRCIGNVTLVEAGCGSGKTLAAYMWARDQIGERRLWFCYPTTGTATEGFRDYLCDPENGISRPGSDLFHSRAMLDKLESAHWLNNYTEDSQDGDDATDTEVRINSLVAWSTMIVSCTVDQALGLLQNHRSGLYAWPALSQSAFVFDEVHCYDDRLFANLLTFLEQLPGLPSLLMTASLPEGRRTAIEAACKRSSRALTVIPGPEDRERLPRYIRTDPEPTVDVAEAEAAVEDELDGSGRVLWISNQVKRCRDVAKRLPSCSPITYHSRFVYRDRQERHREVVELFAGNDSGFATTTQVAELSLDLKHATLLVTELAPIPALIQRLGRLNRSASPDDINGERPLGRLIVIEPRNEIGLDPKPYDEEELKAARQWLAELGNGPISQRLLVDVWKANDDSTSPPPEASHWLMDTGQPTVVPIRTSGFGITVLMQRNVEAARKQGATAYLLPMDAPKRKGWEATYPCRNYPVALEGSIAYDKAIGAEWATFVVF